jgi:Fic family protein
VFNLENTPYSLDNIASEQVRKRLNELEERCGLLRRQGTLTEQTVRDYYGEKRFEQVAESNAIEGSTLSAGETELAVVKGITITGHDPAFVQDAVALDKALSRITELAKNSQTPTDIEQLHEVHALLMGARSGAGIFRSERVSIRGSLHTPPKTWEAVMQQMTEWQTWSKQNISLPAPIRACVIHAWLTHIHPYIDGNGRTSRAIGNLELIRAGYPPIIIKKKERDRYIDALSQSDSGGDIRAFMELIFDKLEGALTGLELSAKKRQGYNPVVEKIRIQQEKQLNIWETSLKLLAGIIEYRAMELLSPVGGRCSIRSFESSLDFDEYVEVCLGNNVTQCNAFIVRIEIPSFPSFTKLAYVGHRTPVMFQALNQEGGPALYWSSPNPAKFPKWISDREQSPFAMEMTSKNGNGDEWFVRKSNDFVTRLQTTELATRIAEVLVNTASNLSANE